MLVKSLSVVLLALSFSVHADESDSQPVYGARPGYIFNVKAEKNRREIEMVMLPPIKKPKKINEILFNEKLSREFQDQYEYRFGKTQAQQIINNPGRFDEYTYYDGQSITVQQYQQYQQTFAEYMGRRLVEYHFDNWAKSDPAVRPIYQLKDKVSNVKVEVKKGYQVKVNYSFSGNNLDVSVDNPYKVETKVTLQMRQAGFGPSTPEEYIYNLAYPVTKKIKVAALYKQVDGLYQIVATRQVTSHISTSVTGSLDTLPAGPVTQQNELLLGFSWNE